MERDPELVGPVRRSLGALDDRGTRVDLLGLHAPDVAGRAPGDVPHPEEVVAEGPDPYVRPGPGGDGGLGAVPKEEAEVSRDKTVLRVRVDGS